MIRIQESLNGGFYTGLGVHDGVRVHARKVRGDLDTLLRTTDAASLSGCMGIIHSRTPSGGDGSWAHPFVTERDGEIRLCYVANGAAGRFQSRNGEYNALADRLVREGFDIPCKIDYTGDRYSRLSTGKAVHMSDVMCQLIYRHRSGGKTLAEAMTAAFCEMPSEIVGLAIEPQTPDRICFSRINMPMFVGFDGTGAYLASSPTAFPARVKDYRLLPALSSGRVYKDHAEVTAIAAFPMEVSAVDEAAVERTAKVILARLREGEAGFRELRPSVREMAPSNALTETDALIYLSLLRLEECGQIACRLSEWTVDGNTAPKKCFAKRTE